MSDHNTECPTTDVPDQTDRILIVDDDPSMRTALMESVRRLGFEVAGCDGRRRCRSSGSAAINPGGRHRFEDAAARWTRFDQGDQESFAAYAYGADDGLRDG